MTEFETTFDVRSTPDEAWKALEDLQPGHVDESASPRRWWLPGFEATGTEVDVEPKRRLTVRKDEWPCPGTLIAVTFDHVASGTRIKVVQSGFDQGFIEASGEGFWIAAEQIAADLVLFWETGVLGGRHLRPWTQIGCAVTPTARGLEVSSVAAGTWADRVGLTDGDLLLMNAGAPMTLTRDLVTVQRIYGPGDELSATWADSGERVEAAALI
jgi:hypothetical protein